jgi:anaerobic magnesium-protoporphyrin IX monomethyl ester cyclase
MPIVERKSIKVALVNPPCPAGAFLHPQFPLKGLAYMVALLLKDGHNVKVMDCPALNMDQDGLRREIDSFEPDIVGITSMTVTFPSALQAALVAKNSCPSALIVLGGPHATVMDIDTLSKFAYVDVVVRREGEQTILELARCVARGESLHRVAGITFRKNSEIMRTADRPFIQNLDELPYPAYQFFPMEKYRFFGKRVFPIMTSRGCPFRCAFCLASKMSGNRIRARNPKNVVDELEWLMGTHGADAFTFHDETFTYDKERVSEIFEEMKNRKIDLPWDCSTRVDQVSKEVLAKMRLANCQLVAFGVESNSPKILSAMKKGTTVEQNEMAVTWAKEVGLSFGVFLIIGYPGETMSTVKQSLDFIRRTEPDDVYISFATPYPSTEFYDLVKEMGWKLSTDWSRYDNITPVFENPLLPAEKMMEIRKKFYDHFYSPSYILRQSLKGDFYSRGMSRTALNHHLWQFKPPKWVLSNFKKLTLQQTSQRNA